jgi:hypothetical protein
MGTFTSSSWVITRKGQTCCSTRVREPRFIEHAGCLFHPGNRFSSAILLSMIIRAAGSAPGRVTAYARNVACALAPGTWAVTAVLSAKVSLETTLSVSATVIASGWHGWLTLVRGTRTTGRRSS